MNAVEKGIIRAVAADKVTRKITFLAKHLVEKWERLASRPKPAALEHHAHHIEEVDRDRDAVGDETYLLCRERMLRDHGGRMACEACHVTPINVGLDPHHIELGSCGRRDAPEVVMLICRDCHTIDPRSAHRAPRYFAQTIVIPWAKAHNYELPNRKEYR